jgi:hypothetical protein
MALLGHSIGDLGIENIDKIYQLGSLTENIILPH